MFRVTKSNPATEADFISYWDTGRRPPRRRPELERSFKAISCFDTLARACAKAMEYQLGEHVAELDVPESVAVVQSHTGHIDLEKTTPGELMRYIIAMHPANPETRVEI